MPASLIALLLGFNPAAAQDGPRTEFDPLVDVRPRAVINHTDGLSRGFLKNASALERARLGLLLKREGVSGFVGVQEYRGWEYDDATSEYVRIEPTFEAFEAWARLEGSLPGNVTADLTAGRQLLSLHGGRLVSDNDFSFRGQPLDALAFNLGLGDISIFAANFRDFSDTSSLDDPGASVFTIGIGNEGPLDRWQVDGVYIVDFFPGSLRNTWGPVASFEVRRWQLDIEAYVQTVDIDPDPDGTSVLVSASTGATIGPERLVTALGGYAVQTSNLTSRRALGAFDSPAGNIYEFWGHMNLFQRPEDTDGRGLQDLFVTLAARPHARLTLEADGHGFWLQRDAASLGGELDLMLRFQASPIGAFEMGMMQFWAGPGLSEVTSTKGPFRTGYIQLRVAIPEAFDD